MLHRLMQIESLKVFCDLVDTASFTKTAGLNGVTQSAVSQQISSLEHAFHSRLVERSKKMMRLTPEGQTVYDHSKEILDHYRSLGHRLQELKDIVSGTIEVATIYSIGLHDLPEYLRQFMQGNPTVHVHVEYRNAAQVYDDVLGNAVDLGLIAYPIKDAKLEIIPLRKEPLVLVCPPDHRFAGKRSIPLAALDGEKLISFEPDTPTRKAIDKILSGAGVAVIHVMEFDNVETVKRAVEIGAGISIIPQSTVRQEIEKNLLVQVDIEDGQFYRPIAAIYKKNRVLSPALKQFLNTLKGIA